MTVVPLDALRATQIDAPIGAGDASSDAFANALGDALEAAGSALRRADASEHAFVANRGGLQEMVVDRAHADVVLSLATAAAARTAQALTTILGMQV